jgi:ABC-type transport system substrate-binding protein
VQLYRPHVLPESLLRVSLGAPLARAVIPAGGEGAFDVAPSEAQEMRFVAKAFAPGGRLAELVERGYADPQLALADLERGEIDLVDRLFPADAARLLEEVGPEGPLVVGRYAVPTLHVLIADESHPYLASQDFRRAVLLAIQRERILHDELLGGRSVPGCRVVSGPFPPGSRAGDPLSYAYDETVSARQPAPELARLLATIVQRQLAANTAGGGAAVDAPRLVLGHPAHEVARVACQAIAAQLELVGIACELKGLPPGMSRDPDGGCDLTYAEIVMCEPLVDARRLLGREGLAATSSPYVDQALRRLADASSWAEARQRLLELHRLCHHDLSVIPLWQITDFFAYHRRLRGVGESPVGLYQNVDQWRLGKPVDE